MEEILKNVKVSNDQHHDLNVKEMIEGYLFIYLLAWALLVFYINLLRRLSKGFTLIIVLKRRVKIKRWDEQTRMRVVINLGRTNV